MTEMEYSLTGEDVLKVLQGMLRLNFDATKMAEVQHILRSVGEMAVSDEVADLISKILQGMTAKERNLAAEIREWVMTTSGHFLTTDVHKELQLTTRGDKKNAIMALDRLCKEGVIDKHGDKRGCYRLRETDLAAMDIMSPGEKPLNVLYPFLIHNLFVTLPRNIILVAGEPDSGKTAWLLNFVKLNMDLYDIHYFNSEMGEMELRSRLSKFGQPSLQEWQKVHWWERSSNFADVIRPDAVNVIDFLEVTEEHYRIGTWISQIHNRLHKGIAVIAIQKKRGAEIGRGGDVTLEKPRLYLNLQPHRAKIVKCKNWRDEDVNPNGTELSFRLSRGCDFIMDTVWAKPEPQAPKKAKTYRDYCGGNG
jgi:hypothetical protein